MQPVSTNVQFIIVLLSIVSRIRVQVKCDLFLECKSTVCCSRGKNIISLDLMNMQRLVLPSKQRSQFNKARVIVIGKKRKEKENTQKGIRAKKKSSTEPLKNIFEAMLAKTLISFCLFCNIFVLFHLKTFLIHLSC